MNETQQRIFNFINYLCSSCTLMSPSGQTLDNMPVLLTRQQLVDKLCLSSKTIERHLEWLIANKYIYRAEIGNNYIYNTRPIELQHDFICRIRC